ncbi:hypothetical protein EYS14_24780 [Alteromonadaceae bacterium M269]|nr:hypothetical protein EYS14_24780 [Alteromonadaceae bacterium M269]
MKATLPIPYAIVFVHDLNNHEIEVPEYEDNTLITSNGECLSIGTQADVDGDVTINLSANTESIEKKGLSKAFEGTIASASKRVAVSTSEGDIVLTMEVECEITVLSIWVDDVLYPSSILIEADGSKGDLGPPGK